MRQNITVFLSLTVIIWYDLRNNQGVHKFTFVILTQRPWLLRYCSPVVRIHVPFFSSMLYLHNFLMWGVWRGFSKTGMSVLAPPAGTPEEAEVVNDESLQTL